MALSIDQLRNAFKQKTETESSSGSLWQKFYKFYKMEFDETANIRFLPDKNEDNPLGFIVENKTHELLVNGKKRQVACLKMYGESCPCCELSAKHYGNGDTTTGKKYYRRVDYLTQAIINSSPFEYEGSDDENPVKPLSLGPMIYKRIEAALTSGDLDTNPTEFVGGYDFRLCKTKKGEYADWSTSDFARRSTDVSEDLLARIDLYDLSALRTQKTEREAMEAMIQADLLGTSYSDEQTTPSSVSEVKSEGNDTPFVSNIETKQEATKTESVPIKSSAQDILARFKAARTAKANQQ